jgi:hypothetical protein
MKEIPGNARATNTQMRLPEKIQIFFSFPDKN